MNRRDFFKSILPGFIAGKKLIDEALDFELPQPEEPNEAPEPPAMEFLMKAEMGPASYSF